MMKKPMEADEMYLRGFLSGLDFCVVNISGDKKKDLSEVRALRKAFRKKAKKMKMVL